MDAFSWSIALIGTFPFLSIKAVLPCKTFIVQPTKKTFFMSNIFLWRSVSEIVKVWEKLVLNWNCLVFSRISYSRWRNMWKFWRDLWRGSQPRLNNTAVYSRWGTGRGWVPGWGRAWGQATPCLGGSAHGSSGEISEEALNPGSTTRLCTAGGG